MKTKYILTLIIFLVILSCNKDSETLSRGNFIEINGDKRTIDEDNPNVEMTYGRWGAPGWQFVLDDKQFCKDIADIPLQQIQVIIDIYDSENNHDLTTDNYALNKYEISKHANLLVRCRDKNGYLIGAIQSNENSGNIKFTMEEYYRVIEFHNIKLIGKGDKIFTLNGRLEFSGHAF